MVAKLPGIYVGALCKIGVEAAEGFGDYASRIDDFEGERLTLAMPMSRGAFVIPAVDERVLVSLRVASGSTLSLECAVERRVGGEDPAMVVHVLSVGKQESRRFFRVAATIVPTDCAVWERGGGRDDAFWRPLPARIVSLSGGGAALRVGEAVPAGARVRLRFPLPFGGGECAAMGRVVGSRSLDTGASNRTGSGTDTDSASCWQCAVEFGETARALRERLVKGINRFQVEERRREVAAVSVAA